MKPKYKDKRFHTAYRPRLFIEFENYMWGLWRPVTGSEENPFFRMGIGGDVFDQLVVIQVSSTLGRDYSPVLNLTNLDGQSTRMLHYHV